MLPLIGIHGKANSGKDTLADMLIKMDSADGMRYSFADPVKLTASSMFGIPIEHFYEREIKEIDNVFWGISPRKMAQIVGTDMARNCFDDQIWIKRAHIEINNLPRISPWLKFVVIPDVRFENEADFIRRNGGKLIHITRPDQRVIQESDHESENGITFKDGDVQFVNGSTLMELEILAKSFYLYEIEKDEHAKELIEQLLDETPEIKRSYQ